MKKNIDIKKAIQQIPVKELREFVEVQIGKNQKFQAAFLKHFEDFFVEKESGDAYVEQVQETMPVICTLSHITKRETSMPYSRRTYLKSNGKPSSVSWPTTC
jgi:hypothetical protein